MAIRMVASKDDEDKTKEELSAEIARLHRVQKNLVRICEERIKTIQSLIKSNRSLLGRIQEIERDREAGVFEGF